MSNHIDDPAHESETRIAFDLRDILTPEQVEKFQAAAAEAHAPNLTEHFLDLTLRHPGQHGRAA